ncbi:hypothetical protein RP20_CCG026252 [Aedes albopictus]|nr:hypothetical protein RP20_CCG026252 [Aedes albopictus]
MAEQEERFVTLAELTVDILGLPIELLKVFEDRGYDAAKLVTVTKDELSDDLSESGLNFNVDEIYQRLFVWRQESGFEIISFAQVEVLEDWSGHEPVETDGETDPDNSSSDTRASVIFRGESSGTQKPDLEPDEPENGTSSAENPAPLCTSTRTPTTETPQAKVELPPEAIPQSSGPSVSVGISSVRPPRASISFGPDQLVALLESSITGKSLLERAKQDDFSTHSQKELVGIVAEHHLSLGIKTTEDTLDNYATAIVLLFKQEKKESYFIPRSGGKRNPGGKLYNRIFNLKQKRATREKFEESRRTKKLKPGSLEIPDSDGDEAFTWLQLNIQPWNTTLAKWTTSFNKRKHNLQNPLAIDTVLKTFRHYRQDHGYQLIDADFHSLYSSASEGLIRLEKDLAVLIEQVSTKYKDGHSSMLVSLLERTDCSRDSQVCAVLILLNNILPPTKISKDFKPTTLVAQEDIILFVSTAEGIRAKVDEVYAMYNEWGLPPTVKLVFVGSGAASLTGQFYVVYKDLVFEAESVARALDILVKTTLVFGLQFSRVTRLVWNFICTHFYEIPGLAKYASVLKFIDQLNKNQ